MIADLKPYPVMKDFGVQWLGEVPEHWEQRSLWTVSEPRVEKNPGGLQLLSVFLNRGVIRYEEGGGQVHAPSLDLTNYQVVHPGDFVLNNQQAWRGSVGVSRHHGIVSPAYIVLRLVGLDAAYANYLFQCPAMVNQFVTASKGVGDIQRQIYWLFLRFVQTLLPPLSEQAAIVRFLDHIDRRIRRYIHAKQKLVKLLEEQKQALIHEAVTGQIDVLTGRPHPAYKDSGVEWLGAVPAHWEMRRLKSKLRPVDRRSSSGTETLLSLRRDFGVVVYGEHFSRPPQGVTLVGYKLVEAGQLVVNRLQANNGLLFCSRLSGVVSPDYSVFAARSPCRHGISRQSPANRYIQDTLPAGINGPWHWKCGFSPTV